MARRKGRLLLQLTLSLSLAIIFLTLASFYYQYQVSQHIMIESIRTDVLRQANLLRAWLNEAKSPPARGQIARQYVETVERLDESRQQVIIVDAQRQVLASTEGQGPGVRYGHDMLRRVVAPDAPVEGINMQVAGEWLVAMPFYAGEAGKKVAGGILLKRPLIAAQRLANSILLNTFVLLAVTLIIIVVVIHYVLRAKVHKPMQAIFMQEYRIREGDLAKIEAEDPRNEFSDLYAMYNEMVARIAEQKKAILEQKDHVALAQLARQAVERLTAPLDEILNRSRHLLEHESSLSEADRKTLREILGNITRIARELKSIVVEGDKSAVWLRREAEKLRGYGKHAAEENGHNRQAGE